MKLKIFCFLLPNDGRSLFSVSIDNDQTVDDLKKAIKREKKPELDHLAADALILYKVLPSSLQTSLSLPLLVARAVDSS